MITYRIALPVLVLLVAAIFVVGQLRGKTLSDDSISTPEEQADSKTENTTSVTAPRPASEAASSNTRKKEAYVELPPWTSVVVGKIVAIEPTQWCDFEGNGGVSCYSGYGLKIAVERQISGQPISEKELFQRAGSAGHYGCADFNQLVEQRRLWKIRHLGKSFEFDPLIGRDYTKKDLDVFVELNAGKITFNQASSYFDREDDLCQVAQATADIESGKADAYGYYNRGRLHEQLGRYENALQDLSKSISLDPKLACSYHVRALTYAALGKRSLAQSDYDKAVSLDPELLKELKPLPR